MPSAASFTQHAKHLRSELICIIVYIGQCTHCFNTCQPLVKIISFFPGLERKCVKCGLIWFKWVSVGTLMSTSDPIVCYGA